MQGQNIQSLLRSIEEHKRVVRNDLTDIIRLCDRCDCFQQLLDQSDGNKQYSANIIADVEAFLTGITEFLNTSYSEISYLEKVSFPNRRKQYAKLEEFNSRLEQTMTRCNLSLDSEALMLRRTEDLQDTLYCYDIIVQNAYTELLSQSTLTKDTLTQFKHDIIEHQQYLQQHYKINQSPSLKQQIDNLHQMFLQRIMLLEKNLWKYHMKSNIPQQHELLLWKLQQTGGVEELNKEENQLKQQWLTSFQFQTHDIKTIGSELSASSTNTNNLLMPSFKNERKEGHSMPPTSNSNNHTTTPNTTTNGTHASSNQYLQQTVPSIISTGKFNKGLLQKQFPIQLYSIKYDAYQSKSHWEINLLTYQSLPYPHSHLIAYYGYVQTDAATIQWIIEDSSSSTNNNNPTSNPLVVIGNGGINGMRPLSVGLGSANGTGKFSSAPVPSPSIGPRRSLDQIVFNTDYYQSLPTTLVVSWVIDILSAIHYLHSYGYYQMIPLTLSNIYLNDYNQVQCILDVKHSHSTIVADVMPPANASMSALNSPNLNNSVSSSTGSGLPSPSSQIMNTLGPIYDIEIDKLPHYLTYLLDVYELGLLVMQMLVRERDWYRTLGSPSAYHTNHFALKGVHDGSGAPKSSGAVKMKKTKRQIYSPIGATDFASPKVKGLNDSPTTRRKGIAVSPDMQSPAGDIITLISHIRLILPKYLTDIHPTEQLLLQQLIIQCIPQPSRTLVMHPDQMNSSSLRLSFIDPAISFVHYDGPIASTLKEKVEDFLEAIGGDPRVAASKKSFDEILRVDSGGGIDLRNMSTASKSFDDMKPPSISLQAILEGESEKPSKTRSFPAASSDANLTDSELGIDLSPVDKEKMFSRSKEGSSSDLSTHGMTIKEESSEGEKEDVIVVHSLDSDENILQLDATLSAKSKTKVALSESNVESKKQNERRSLSLSKTPILLTSNSDKTLSKEVSEKKKTASRSKPPSPFQLSTPVSSTPAAAIVNARSVTSTPSSVQETVKVEKSSSVEVHHTRTSHIPKPIGRTVRTPSVDLPVGEGSTLTNTTSYTATSTSSTFSSTTKSVETKEPKTKDLSLEAMMEKVNLLSDMIDETIENKRKGNNAAGGNNIRRPSPSVNLKLRAVGDNTKVNHAQDPSAIQLRSTPKIETTPKNEPAAFTKVVLKPTPSSARLDIKESNSQTPQMMYVPEPEPDVDPMIEVNQVFGKSESIHLTPTNPVMLTEHSDHVHSLCILPNPITVPLPLPGNHHSNTNSSPGTPTALSGSASASASASASSIMWNNLRQQGGFFFGRSNSIRGESLSANNSAHDGWEDVDSSAHSQTPQGQISITIHFLSGSADYTIKLWNLSTMQCVYTLFGHAGAVTALSYIEKGNLLISASFDEAIIRIWDLTTLKCVKFLSGHQKGITNLFVFSPTLFVTTSLDYTIKVWEIIQSTRYSSSNTNTPTVGTTNTPSTPTTPRENSSSGSHNTTAVPGLSINTAAHSSSFTLNATSAGNRSSLVSWWLSQQQNKSLLSPKNAHNTSNPNISVPLSISPLNGSFTSAPIVPPSPTNTTGNSSGVASTNFRCVQTLYGHQDSIRVAIQILATMSAPASATNTSNTTNNTNNTIPVNHRASGEWKSPINTPHGATTTPSHYHHTTINNTALFREKRSPILPHHVHQHVTQQQHVSRLPSTSTPSSSQNATSFQPSHHHIVTGSLDRTIKLWSLHTGQCEKTFIGHRRSITALIYLPNRKQILSGSSDAEIKLWDIESSRCIYTLIGHEDGITSMVMLPATDFLLSASRDATMKLWKLPDWTTSTANPVMLTPQTGTMIMISPTKKCIKTYKGHEREITLLKEMTIQHTKQIFTASNDSTVKIWSLLKERCKQTLEGHGDKINAMEMITNSTAESPFQMITASDDGSISVWKFQIHSASS